MRLRGTALVTTLLLAFVSVMSVLSAGCTEKEEKAWEENQRALLLEYLDRPGVTYGEITLDGKAKSWIVNDYAVTMEYDVYPGVKASLEAQSLTGVGVVFEPVTERSLLAKKMVYKGLALTGPFYGKARVLCEEAVAENMYGGAEVQKNMLGFADGIVKSQMFADMSFQLKAKGIRIVDEAGASLGSMQSFAYEMKGLNVSENILATQLVVTPPASDVDVLSIEEISVEKVSIGRYQELLALLKKYESLVLKPEVDDLVVKELMAVMQYDLQGLALKNASLTFTGALPPLTLQSARFDGAFAQGNNSQAWRLEGLKVASEYLDTLLADSPLFGFPFATYDLSAVVDFTVQMDGEEVESMQVAKLALHDANLGGVSLSLFMGTEPLEGQDAAMARPQQGVEQDAGSLEPEQSVPEQLKLGQSEKAYRPDGPSDGFTGGSMLDDAPENGASMLDKSTLNPFEGTVRPGYFKDVQVTVTDTGFVKTLFDMAAVLGGVVEVENATTGGDLLRHGAAVSLAGICKQFEGDMNTACLNTAKLLSKGGEIEYKLAFDKPLNIDIDPYALLGGVPVNSTYRPLEP